jgi:hypothetical protein
MDPRRIVLPLVFCMGQSLYSASSAVMAEASAFKIELKTPRDAQDKTPQAEQDTPPPDEQPLMESLQLEEEEDEPFQEELKTPQAEQASLHHAEQPTLPQAEQAVLPQFEQIPSPQLEPTFQVDDLGTLKLDGIMKDARIGSDKNKLVNMTGKILEEIWAPSIAKGEYKALVKFVYDKLPTLKRDKQLPAINWLKEYSHLPIPLYLSLRDAHTYPQAEYTQDEIESFWYTHYLGKILVEMDFAVLHPDQDCRDFYIQLRDVVDHYYSRMDEWMSLIRGKQPLTRDIFDTVIGKLENYLEHFQYQANPRWLPVTAVSKSWVYGEHFAHQGVEDCKAYQVYKDEEATEVALTQAYRLIEKWKANRDALPE